MEELLKQKQREDERIDRLLNRVFKDTKDRKKENMSIYNKNGLPEYMFMVDIIECTRISRYQILKRIKKGELSVIKIGKEYVFKAEDARPFLEKYVSWVHSPLMVEKIMSARPNELNRKTKDIMEKLGG